MAKLYLNYIDQLCVLAGICACAHHVISAYLNAEPLFLGRIITILFAGSLVPMGVMFILCPFMPEFRHKIVEKEVCIVAAGIAILFASFSGLY